MIFSLLKQDISQSIKKTRYLRGVLIGAFIIGFTILIQMNWEIINGEQHYVFLAKSFLRGKLYFLQKPSQITHWLDTSIHDGNYYWPLGVFPAIVMMPFVWYFGMTFTQGKAAILFIFISTYFLYAIANRFLNDKTKSFFLTFAYLFSTAYVGVAMVTLSWYFAHVVATACLLGSIYFVVVKDRPQLAGLLFGLAFLSRLSIILGILFYLLYYFDKKDGIKKFVRFSIPLTFCVLFFFVYNYARFGNILETGYTNQTLVKNLENSRELQMWGPRNFPTNIYYLLLKGPEIDFVNGTLTAKMIYPNVMGMSIVFTSPILLYTLISDPKKKINKLALAGIVPILIFLLGSFGIGAFQYGYRFTLDFQPFLYLILIDVFKDKRVNVANTLLVLITFVFNVLMLYLRFFTWYGDSQLSQF